MGNDEKTQQLRKVTRDPGTTDAHRPHVRPGAAGLVRRGESRVCPLCRARGDARLCANDGYLTVAVTAGGAVPDLRGKALGNYLVGELLSESPRSLIYAGTQLTVGRPVVLKVRRYCDARHLRGHARFQTEARTLASLDNPHVVQLIDLGLTPDNIFFMALERLHGETLEHLLRRTRLTPAAILAIAGNIADGLAGVHEAGLVLRNAGSDNVVVLRGRREVGAVKLVDLRLVKHLDPPQPVVEAPPVTRSGELVGEPRYLSPEQALGGEITPATDVYALGVMIYEMMTGGQHPFPRDTAAEQAAAAVTDKPAPPTLDDKPLGGALVDLALRFMHRKPSRRPADGAAALQALREVEGLKASKQLFVK